MENPFSSPRGLLALAGAFALSSTAHAAPDGGSVQLAAAVATSAPATCAVLGSPVAGSLTKASSILGGQVSALDRIQQQQAGVSRVPASVSPATSPDCGRLAARPELGSARSGRGMAALDPANFLASKRLPVRKTVFDAQWARVSHANVSAEAAAAASRAAPGRPSTAMLAAVNSWANRTIRYVEDRQLYGRADFWADAPTTLRRGAGDCEDIAIAKLALLAAAGVRRQDMFLTIARDLVRNADHAVLVVRLDDRFYMLDNSTDRLLDASESYDYRPILSYSSERKWLHGY